MILLKFWGGQTVIHTPILIRLSTTVRIPLKLSKCYLQGMEAREAYNSARGYLAISSENSITHLEFSLHFSFRMGKRIVFARYNTRISFRRYSEWIAFYSIKASHDRPCDLWSIRIKRGLGYVYLGHSHQLLLQQRRVRHKRGLVFRCESYFYAIFLADISYCGAGVALPTRKIAL